MTALTLEYTDLNRALDEVRPLLEDWAAEHDEAAAPSDDTVRYTQLVLHEWIANLLQHAHFKSRAPTVQIRASTENRHITCAVIDNSEGFDLAEQLSPDDDADDFPERGMGLQIIDACTNQLSYTSTASGRHRLEFTIPADQDPCLSMLF
ncbi:MAG: ATP-binding protein [Bacteroidetes bacterium QH_1_61_8]|nr:MAG: ATP-binding protein [Bacteroidetes bacterium QH_1_61_8]